MIIKKAEFIITAVEPKQYPDNGWPEIALAGRSNVGKSSLINSLLNRKSLARVGNTPGKTRVVNFYNVNDELMLVDLPGYGYAKVSKEEKKTWGNLTETYLMGRKSLKAILLLVDIRHEPTDDDCIMMNYIRESGRRTAVIATKADKLNRPEYKKQIDMIRTVLYLDAETEVVPFSSLKRIGIADVWSATENLLK
jgi:GTP-binding protein